MVQKLYCSFQKTCFCPQYPFGHVDCCFGDHAEKLLTGDRKYFAGCPTLLRRETFLRKIVGSKFYYGHIDGSFRNHVERFSTKGLETFISTTQKELKAKVFFQQKFFNSFLWRSRRQLWQPFQIFLFASRQNLAHCSEKLEDL